MNTKKIVAFIALAFSVSAFAADDGGIQSSGNGDDLIQKAKGWLGGVAESLSKGTAKAAEVLKDKQSVWPDVAESASVQLFPAYPGGITCFRFDQMSLGTPQDDQARFCAAMDQKLRGTYYHYITFAPDMLMFKSNGEPEKVNALRTRYTFANAAVVAMPQLQNTVTCWKANVEGDGPKECQALRPLVKDTPFKYAVIPDAAKLREIVKFNSTK